MSITVDLPDTLLRRLEATAAQQGRAPQDLLAEYLEQGLSRSEPGSPPALETGPRRRSEPPSFVPAASTGETIPALSNREIAAILDEEDAQRVL